jgi:hypothetical protein
MAGQIKLLDKVQPNKTTLCVVPCTTTENDERNVTAERRSLKAMSCSLYGIPMVSSAWIQECLQEKKIILPKSLMYIRSLPTKSNIPSSSFGVAFRATSMYTSNLQEPHTHKSGGKLLQSVGTAFLVGFSNKDETNFSSLLRQAGVSEVVVNKHAALSKLKAICKKEAATQKQNKTKQSALVNRFVFLCSDTQNVSLSESFVSTVREYYCIPRTIPQLRIACVSIQWLFDSISCGAQLEADMAAPDIHPPSYYYRPIDPHAKDIWEMTVQTLGDRPKS